LSLTRFNLHGIVIYDFVSIFSARPVFSGCLTPVVKPTMQRQAEKSFVRCTNQLGLGMPIWPSKTQTFCINFLYVQESVIFCSPPYGPQADYRGNMAGVTQCCGSGSVSIPSPCILILCLKYYLLPPTRMENHLSVTAVKKINKILI
jgi:hypothetical protein